MEYSDCKFKFKKNKNPMKIFKLKVDPDSALAKDLASLKSKGQNATISLSFHFDANFPFSPPFVRVVSPVIQGGYVLSGGAICMEAGVLPFRTLK